jgi:hypothetical protein
MLVLFPLLSLLTLALAESQEYENARIVHRYFHPLHAPDAPYTLRGTVRLGTSGASAVYQPVGQFNDLLKGLSNKDVSSEDPSWLYQVAFEHHGRLDMSSVKAVSLSHSYFAVSVSSASREHSFGHFCS